MATVLSDSMEALHTLQPRYLSQKAMVIFYISRSRQTKKILLSNKVNLFMCVRAALLQTFGSRRAGAVGNVLTLNQIALHVAITT